MLSRCRCPVISVDLENPRCFVSLRPSLHTHKGGCVRDISMSDQPQYYRVTDSLENLSVRIRLRKVRVGTYSRYRGRALSCVQRFVRGIESSLRSGSGSPELFLPACPILSFVATGSIPARPLWMHSLCEGVW